MRLAYSLHRLQSGTAPSHSSLVQLSGGSQWQTVSRAPGLQLQVSGEAPGHDGQLEVSLPGLWCSPGREDGKTDNDSRTPSASIPS